MASFLGLAAQPRPRTRPAAFSYPKGRGVPKGKGQHGDVRYRWMLMLGATTGRNNSYGHVAIISSQTNSALG